MMLYNLNNYGSGTNTLKKKIQDAGKYIRTISSNMNQIQQTAQGWLNNAQITQSQTNLKNLAVINQSLNDLAGLNGTLKDFISNWNSNNDLLNGDLNTLNSFIAGNWNTYNSNLNKSINYVQSIISQISQANTTVTSTLTNNNSQVSNLISSQTGIANGQSTPQLLTAIQNDQTTITNDISNWNTQVQNLSALLGNTQNGIPTSVVPSNFNATTPSLSDLQTIVSNLTNPTILSSNMISLSQQLAAWTGFFNNAFINELNIVNSDVQEAKAGNTLMTMSTIKTDIAQITAYVAMLYTLSSYWVQEINAAVATINNMDGLIKTIALDTNKMVDELKAIIMTLNNALGTDYPFEADLQKVQNNLQSYASQLQQLSLGSTAESAGKRTGWIIGIAAVGIAALAGILYHRRKGGKANG